MISRVIWTSCVGIGIKSNFFVHRRTNTNHETLRALSASVFSNNKAHVGGRMKASSWPDLTIGGAGDWKPFVLQNRAFVSFWGREGERNSLCWFMRLTWTFAVLGSSREHKSLQHKSGLQGLGLGVYMVVPGAFWRINSCCAGGSWSSLNLQKFFSPLLLLHSRNSPNQIVLEDVFSSLALLTESAHCQCFSRFLICDSS